MTSHLERMRAHMDRETQGLKHLAKAAREFDNAGNRGSEAEHALARWLTARFAPSYTVSSGEILDSFDTDVLLDSRTRSRQQDVVLHANDANANRFVLPSGKRLLPIESVVAAIEVKLTVDATKFRDADAKATELSQLRVRPGLHAYINMTYEPPNIGHSLIMITDEQRKNGIAVSDPAFLYPPVVFALFAFESDVTDNNTLSRWLDQAKTISLVCCLSTGCVYRGTRPFREIDEVTAAEEALTHFVECLARSITRYAEHVKYFEPDYDRYAPHTPSLRHVRSQGGGASM